MQQNTIIVPNIALEKLRQNAKKLKRETGIPHYQALDQAAQKSGFNHWHHVVESAKLTSLTETAYYAGLVIGLDVKDSEEFQNLDGCFLEDDQFPYLVKSDFLEEAKSEVDEDGHKLSDSMSEDEIEQLVMEDMWNYTFFRFDGKSLPKDINKVLELVSKYSYWPPLFIWFKGEFYDTYSIPVLDKDKNITGFRL